MHGIRNISIKKIILGLILFCFMMVMPVFAEEYETGRDLWNSWNGEYPFYSCGVWSDDSEDISLVFGITDKKYKDEILSRITEKSGIKVVVKKYSYSYLKEVESKVLSEADGRNLLSAVIFEKENYVSIICSADLSFLEKIKLASIYYGRYGKAVKVVFEEYMYDDAKDREETMSSGSNSFMNSTIDMFAGRYPIIRGLILAGIVLVVAIVMWKKKQRKNDTTLQNHSF